MPKFKIKNTVLRKCKRCFYMRNNTECLCKNPCSYAFSWKGWGA